MAILEKEVWVTCGTRMDEYYESLGYVIPKYKTPSRHIKVKRGTKILVKIEDLPKKSAVKVKFVCDYCKGENQTEEKSRYKPYHKILSGRAVINKDCCSNDTCLRKKSVESRKSKPIPKGKSLGEMYPHLISEWSKKNEKSPFEFTHGTETMAWWDCPDCKSEYDMKIVFRTYHGCNCPYCAGMRVNHTNSMWTTHPEAAKLLKNPKRGYEITATGGNREEFKCDVCGTFEIKSVYDVAFQGYSCAACSDGISYPEKFVYNMLSQLNIKIERQKSFEWAKNVNSRGTKRYDFYIPSLNCIIETHGKQHYRYTGRGRSLEEEQENDRIKEMLAKENGIEDYIVINCSLSDPNFIKSNIINSKLNKILQLESIDWKECHSKSLTSLIKWVCSFWGEYNNVNDISKVTDIESSTVRRYLIQGSKIGLCDYDSKESGDKTRKINLKKAVETRSVKVIQLTVDGDFVKEWKNTAEVYRELGINNITTVCRGRQATAGGYRWVYESDYKNNKENLTFPKPRRRRVFQLDLEGNPVKEFESIIQASRDTGINEVSISGVCKGKGDTAGGFNWMYKEDYELANK